MVQPVPEVEGWYHRATRTGLWACAATAAFVEPSSKAVNPPCPRDPTTVKALFTEASMRACAGWSLTTLMSTDTSGNFDDQSSTMPVMAL